MNVDDLKRLCNEFKEIIKDTLHNEFPDNAMDQLWGGVGAVFQSWMGKRAISYRKIEGIPRTGEQPSMCRQWSSETPATLPQPSGFHPQPGNREDMFFGEWLPNAQGEDVVAA